MKCLQNFVLSAFSSGACEYCFDRENVRFTLLLDSGLFQSEDIHQHVNREMHQHGYFEWFFITNGRMRLTTENQSLELGKNDFVIIGPGVRHRTNFLQDGTTRYNLNFAFANNHLASTEDLYAQLQALLDSAACVSGTGGDELADVSRRLSQLCGTDRRAMISACFCELLTSVQDTLRVQSPTTAPENVLRDESIPREKRLERLFESYYMYNCSLTLVAECLGISTRQLNRIVRQQFGNSFHKHLAYMRICSARQLLEKTDFNVREIAQWVGYDSLCSFYHAFKEECGCLPTEYRKRIQTEKTNER